MAHKSIGGSPELARAIKNRRIELDMTVEEAAYLADVGTKSWSRYESGEPIRADKCTGVCRALGWYALPGTQEEIDFKKRLKEYEKHEAWSKHIADNYGVNAAISFALGSDILLDSVVEDLSELAKLPKGSHIGQIPCSRLEGILPQQFLMCYDYDFLYLMQTKILELRAIAKDTSNLVAHTVLEELVIYLFMDETRFLTEDDSLEIIPDDKIWEEWVFDLFDDDDLHTYLYNKWYISEGHPYHFDNWTVPQFYCPADE